MAEQWHEEDVLHLEDENEPEGGDNGDLTAYGEMGEVLDNIVEEEPDRFVPEIARTALQRYADNWASRTHRRFGAFYSAGVDQRAAALYQELETATRTVYVHRVQHAKSDNRQVLWITKGWPWVAMLVALIHHHRRTLVRRTRSSPDYNSAFAPLVAESLLERFTPQGGIPRPFTHTRAIQVFTAEAREALYLITGQLRAAQRSYEDRCRDHQQQRLQLEAQHELIRRVAHIEQTQSQLLSKPARPTEMVFTPPGVSSPPVTNPPAHSAIGRERRRQREGADEDDGSPSAAVRRLQDSSRSLSTHAALPASQSTPASHRSAGEAAAAAAAEEMEEAAAEVEAQAAAEAARRKESKTLKKIGRPASKKATVEETNKVQKL